MGFIQNFYDWLDKRKNRKLIGEAIEKTKEAEKNPEKNTSEVMVKSVNENPRITNGFVKAAIKTEDISDKTVGDFLKKAPVEVARKAIDGIRNLDDDINVNKEHVNNVAEGIFTVAKKIENSRKPDLDYGKMEEALENMTPPNLSKEQEKMMDKQRKEMEQVKIRKTKEQLEKVYNSNLYDTNETDLYYKISQFIDRKMFKEIPEGIQQEINKIVAKKKALEFKKYGTIVLKEEIQYIDLEPEKLLKNNIPSMIEEEYKNSTVESTYDDKDFLKTVYKTSKLKIAVIDQIMNKIAFQITHSDEKQIEPFMEYIRENNPDLSKEEVSKIEKRFINATKTFYDKDNRRFNEDNFRARINGTSEKIELLSSIDNQLQGLEQGQLSEIQKFVTISQNFTVEEMGKINDVLDGYAKKKEIKKHKENSELQKDKDETQR